jgi:hypothetical protein
MTPAANARHSVESRQALRPPALSQGISTRSFTIEESTRVAIATNKIQNGKEILTTKRRFFSNW